MAEVKISKETGGAYVDIHEVIEDELERIMAETTSKPMAKRIDKVINSIDFMAHGLKLVSEANQAEHWATKMRRKHAQQEEIAIAWANNLKGRRIELPCVVKLTRIGPKALDKDNLAGSFKHAQDQLARLLQVDDGDASKVSWEYAQMPIGIREYGVKVEISTRK